MSPLRALRPDEQPQISPALYQAGTTRRLDYAPDVMPLNWSPLRQKAGPRIGQGLRCAYHWVLLRSGAGIDEDSMPTGCVGLRWTSVSSPRNFIFRAEGRCFACRYTKGLPDPAGQGIPLPLRMTLASSRETGTAICCSGHHRNTSFPPVGWRDLIHHDWGILACDPVEIWR